MHEVWCIGAGQPAAKVAKPNEERLRWAPKRAWSSVGLSLPMGLHPDCLQQECATQVPEHCPLDLPLPPTPGLLCADASSFGWLILRHHP